MRTKIFTLFTVLLIGFSASVKAQMYDKIAHYSISGTPTHGVKIKTNIPFQPGVDMATIKLYGYAYGLQMPMDLQISFYIWNENNSIYFHEPVVTSSAPYTPNILLVNENGKVVLFLDSKVYYHHFYVDAFSGYNKPAFYQGWSIIDEAVTGNSVTPVDYKNGFSGNITLPNGKWTSEGKLGVGTTTPKEMLSVNGKIRAHEVKVETANWPDYVFKEDYELMSLEEIHQYIKGHGHLPEIPNAEIVEQEGLFLGEMNKLLLKKIEELTLHLIEKDKRISRIEKLLETNR